MIHLGIGSNRKVNPALSFRLPKGIQYTVYGQKLHTRYTKLAHTHHKVHHIGWVAKEEAAVSRNSTPKLTSPDKRRSAQTYGRQFPSANGNDPDLADL